MARRADNHVDTVVAELDEDFFATGILAGNSYEPGSSLDTIEKKLEDMIQTLETVKNNYVRGIPRNIMRLVCSPSFYGEIRNYLDKSTGNASVDSAAEAFEVFHGVRAYSSVYMPADIDAILMIDGAIAQPVVIYPYKAPEKNPAVERLRCRDVLRLRHRSAYSRPDLLLCERRRSHRISDVTSTDSETAGKTIITVNKSPLPGRKFVYKTDSSTAPSVTYNAVLTTGWTDLPADGEISATNGHKITVAEIDVDDNKAKKAGNTTIVVA